MPGRAPRQTPRREGRSVETPATRGPVSHPNIRTAPDGATCRSNYQTAAGAKDTLSRQVSATREPLLAYYAYVDSLQILSVPEIADHALTHLRAAAANPRQVVPFTPKPYGYRGGLRVHQPTDKLLQLLVELVPGHIANRVDFSLELETASQRDADYVRCQLQHTVTLPWHGLRTTTTSGDVDFYALPWRRRNIATYADQPLKATGGPGAYLDFRYYGADVCRDLGVRSAGDLIGRDPYPFVRKFRFSRILMKRVDKWVEQEAGRLASHYRNYGKQPPPAYSTYPVLLQRIRRMVLAYCGDEELPTWSDLPNLAAQDLIDATRPFRNVAVHLPSSALLDGLPAPMR